MRTAALAALLVALAAAPGHAQSSFSSDARAIVAEVLTDPTTYAPALATEIGKSLDWTSSQRFFAAGYVEDNPYYTITGLPHDRPVSRGTGHQINFRVSLQVLASSMANNAITSVASRALAARWPEHKRLIRVASIAERVAFAFGTAYLNSAGNFQQWRRNVHTVVPSSAVR
jgi:hypothetical protein